MYLGFIGGRFPFIGFSSPELPFEGGEEARVCLDTEGGEEVELEPSEFPLNLANKLGRFLDPYRPLKGLAVFARGMDKFMLPFSWLSIALDRVSLIEAIREV